MSNAILSETLIYSDSSIIPLLDVARTQAPKPRQTVFGKDADIFKDEWIVRCAADRGVSFRQDKTPGLCQRCGKTHLRYSHELERAHAEGRIEVGKECAKILCPSYNAERAERNLKNRDRRLKRWMKDWRPSVVGNQYLNGWNYEVGIVQCHPGFRWWISGHVHIWSKITYASCREAQFSLFDYLNSKNLLGDDPLPAGSFSLTRCLQEIEGICKAWFEPFSRGPNGWFFTAFITNLGRLSCTIDEQSPCKWNYRLVLPKPKQWVQISGQPEGYRSVGLAKLDALDDFQTLMTEIAYGVAGLETGPIPLPLTELGKQKLLTNQAEEELKEQRRKAEEESRLAKEEEWKRSQRRQHESQVESYFDMIERRQGTYQPRKPPVARSEKPHETIYSYQERLNQFASPRSMLHGCINRLCSNWRSHFKQNQKGNYTASLPIDTLTARCNVFRRESENWGVGIFMPLGITGPCWSDGVGYTAEGAIANAREMFRSVAAEWIEEVVPM